MKTTLSIIYLLFFTTIFCQEKLKIEYEFRNEFDFEKTTNQISREIYKNSNDNRLYFELITSKNESTFNKIDRVDNSQNKSGTSISFVSGPGGFYYKNLKEKYSLSEINYNNKNLLIYDSIKQMKWIIKKEYTKILGFDVKKATLQESENTFIEAWYAPKLEFKNGPTNYDGLPGVILKLTMINKDWSQENKQIYSAIKVNVSDRFKISKPTKGKQLNQNDFEKMIQEDNIDFNETFLQK
ncbi:GLPGLI family protein [Empedobacter sp.]|uniref:GLPGLI family protein n=1 Tax=Empedobacter sp. TaxID=1927715 RepID=UPI0028A8ED95|nr:GLPGLI family protein [Empedobacter sp.]